jgi:hypothetical protein
MCGWCVIGSLHVAELTQNACRVTVAKPIPHDLLICFNGARTKLEMGILIPCFACQPEYYVEGMVFSTLACHRT